MNRSIFVSPFFLFFCCVVPINVVASFKKIKAAINSNSQLASILRNSNKLVSSLLFLSRSFFLYTFFSVYCRLCLFLFAFGTIHSAGG